MDVGETLPQSFLEKLKELESSFLLESDPIRQSGFGGGPQRWRTEREPLLEALEEDGDLLDIGCANGYLLECLVIWGRERGRKIVPHGLDCGRRLIALARQRLPHWADNFHVGNGWDWRPPRRYRYVYTLNDCVPQHYLEEYVRRALDRLVAPGGRLILGSYGSRSRGVPPADVYTILTDLGLRVVGQTKGGQPPVSSFVWVDWPVAEESRSTIPHPDDS